MNLRIVMACFCALTTSLPAQALTVRVAVKNGIPRICVDEVPVRARMFYGAPGHAPLKLTTSWQTFVFEFAASGSASNGTLHFRFGQQPGTIWLDDIVIERVSTTNSVLTKSDFEAGEASFARDWTFWPQGPANTVGAISVVRDAESSVLQVSLKAPPDEKWPDFHIYHHARLELIKGQNYRVTFRARSSNERDLTVGLYRPGARYVRIGGPPDVFVQQIKLAGEADVQFITFPIGLPWPKPGDAVDWGEVDEACETVLHANPRALLIPRVPMDPPRWWREAHPDEVMQFEDGHRDLMVVSSEIYQRDACDRLRALVQHLEEKFGDNVAGYHPCGQNTGEWFYQDTWKRLLSGFAPADARAWRQWLEKKDKTKVLRTAWRDWDSTPQVVNVPPAADRHAHTNGIFRDFYGERRLVEWALFQQQAMADCVCALAHAAREASRGRKLVLFFYGYVFEFAAVENGPATSGHYALRRVLNSPDIDVLCSPISYFDRGLGGSAPSMSAAESVMLAGKLWLNEDDTHTYLATGTPPGSREHVTTLEETNAELTRNVAQEALRHFGTWWMDLGATGWFNDRRMWQQWVKLRELDNPYDGGPPYQPEVAVVVDEQSICALAAGSTAVTRPGIYEARAALGRMGAPYGQYLLDDVAAGRVNAKMYVFLNAWWIDSSTRESLRRVTRRALCVWCYAPASYAWIQQLYKLRDRTDELSGYKFVHRPADKNAIFEFTEAGRAEGLGITWASPNVINPLFSALEPEDGEVLATYSNGIPAVLWRPYPGVRSVFVGPPGLTSELLRAAAREAGVHLFTTNDCIVYANGPYIALHGCATGPLLLNTPGAGTVVDVLTSEQVGRGPHVTVPLKRGETRVFVVTPPAR